MKSHWLPVALVISALPQLAMAQGQLRKIEVQATGEVTLPADELRLPLQILTTGNHFGTVKDRNDQLLEGILELAADHQLPRPAIESTTATFDFSPKESRRHILSGKANQQAARNKGDDPFDSSESGDIPRPPLRMVRRLTLRFEDMSHATEVLTELTDWDAVQVTREVLLSPLQAGLQVVLRQQRKARRLAVKRAKEKAAELAEASGLQLGAPISVDEATSNADFDRFTPPFDDPFDSSYPRFRPMGRLPGAAAPEDDSAPAQVTTSVGVVVVFEAWRPE